MGAKREGSDLKTRKKKEILPQKRERKSKNAVPPPHTQKISPLEKLHSDLDAKRKGNDLKKTKRKEKGPQKDRENEIEMTLE